MMQEWQAQERRALEQKKIKKVRQNNQKKKLRQKTKRIAGNDAGVAGARAEGT